MSLINDMLKDLDQRRKDSDSGSARVKLTPASDFPKRKKTSSINPTYLIAGLSFAVVALGYAWLQLSTNSPARPESQNPIPMSPLVADSEPPSVSQPVQSEPVTQEVQEPDLPAIQPDNGPEEVENVLAQVVKQNELAQLAESTASQSPSPASPTPSVPRNQIQNPVVNESLAKVNASSGTNKVSLTSGIGIDRSIKNAVEVSEDEEDTLAVQEALGLIANNQLAKAYEILETHINENRYAHQSRETYAKLLVSAQQYQDAYNLLESGLALTPNHPGFKKVKARILILNGQVVDAVQLLLARAPRVADDPEYHEILASAQLATKDFAGASISYSGLVGVNQTEGKFWYGYAAAQELLGNSEVAKQAYSRAVQQASLSASLRRRSQDRLLALGQ